jgi:YidC/Oxa1 family membrane protein insertase
MERVSRIILIVLLVGGAYFFFGGFGGKTDDIQPLVDHPVRLPEGPLPEPAQCELWTPEYHATIAARGGSIRSFETLTAKYRHDKKPIQFATTPDHPQLSPLFTSLRNSASGDRPDDLLSQDIVDFRVESASAAECVLKYESGGVRLTKTYRVGSAPYSVDTELNIENVGTAKANYSLVVSTMSYLKDADVENKMFRANPLATHLECVAEDGSVKREGRDQFEPKSFEDKTRFVKSLTNDGNWSEAGARSLVAAVSSSYFTSAISHESGPSRPSCQLQIEDRFNPAAYGSKKNDPDAAAIYKARLAYEPRSLDPGKSEVFKFKAYIGPKERKALALAGSRFDPLIDLGFFSIIAKVLVQYLLFLRSLVPNWGIAIVLLTITARILLFPLSVPSVRNMIHMRELKPEMDRINERFKDDAQAKGLAQMELWKKHGVNPMKGCLPQLASMPVWFALYTTLQTAVELYNIPFLWFPDLSAPDPYYILPFVIGGVNFVQQKMMPMQGGDPAQQKMMLYLMPAMFTLFMLFLPAGLGIYMFTNSLLGIAQQRVVEQHAKKTLASRRLAKAST